VVLWQRMKTRVLIIIGMILVGFTSSVYAQYMGGKDPPGTVLEECIGPQGACPEERLVKQIENDQNNAILVLVIGIPSFGVMIGFVIWRKRK
jgi:hypothetical protein